MAERQTQEGRDKRQKERVERARVRRRARRVRVACERARAGKGCVWKRERGAGEKETGKGVERRIYTGEAVPLFLDNHSVCVSVWMDGWMDGWMFVSHTFSQLPVDRF